MSLFDSRLWIILKEKRAKFDVPDYHGDPKSVQLMVKDDGPLI